MSLTHETYVYVLTEFLTKNLFRLISDWPVFIQKHQKNLTNLKYK